MSLGRTGTPVSLVKSIGLSTPLEKRPAGTERPRWGVHGRDAMSDLGWQEWGAC